MCLGIPGRIIEITDPANYLAKVDVSGVQRTISVRLLEEDMPEPDGFFLAVRGQGQVGVARVTQRLGPLGLAVSGQPDPSIVDVHQGALSVVRLVSGRSASPGSARK